jgi:hypothetical protein
MKVSAATVLVFGTLLFAAPAFAQYYPSQPPPPPPPPQYYPPPAAPPPQYYPPAPPPAYYQPPSPVYYQPQPMEEAKTHYTIRASGGVAFASNGYYCNYYYTFYTTAYSCTAGYSAVWPDVNLDVDIWIRPTLGITLGANVMWGTYTPSNVVGVPSNSISSTTWEPHIDFLAGIPGNPQVKGRVRLGFGLYIAEANGLNGAGQNFQFNGVGGALRLGIGATFLPKSLVGIGVDAIFEAGWVGSSYVSTVQLLIGPELHF